MKTGKTIGTLAADNLIVDGKHSLDVKGVSIVQAANAKAQEVSEEAAMKATKAYASGDIIKVGDNYYTASAAITSGDTLTAGTNVTALTVATETDFVASSGYDANDYFTLNGVLYKVQTGGISAGGTIFTDTDDFPAYTIPRGTILQVSGTTASVFSDGDPDCILADDLVVETSGSYLVEAYKSGNFAKQTLEEINSVTLSAANIETLRGKGIFVEGVVE
ncbi:MAG: hypothetical protein ACTTK0_02550 [Stomatobaculum sp.]